MPGISGIDLAIQMRDQYPTCKVLLFSGHAATFDLLENARARGHDFDLLLKPVPPTEFLLEVSKMVNGTAKIHPFTLPSQTVSGGAARQSIPNPVQISRAKRAVRDCGAR
jgi:DNA-binding NarL/FixJ family response regulator